MQLILAEKPSVARDLARALGVGGRGEGALEGNGRCITWCIGHLVELVEPAHYNPGWKAWSLNHLPMLPEPFALQPVKTSLAQWRVVKRLLCDRRFEEVVNACDAGREGELIFRLCYELAGARMPVRRLWISSLTDAAIRAGFAKLEPGAKYQPLADAARSRAEADWLVGMNATRAVTLRGRAAGSDALFTLGRVQTPTLAMVVGREKRLRDFVPRPFWEVEGRFTSAEGQRFLARWVADKETRLAEPALAAALITRLKATPLPPSGPRVSTSETRRQRVSPPKLFDLTSLQRTANARFGFSAQHTLDLAQALYERHKLLTYPRTDARHLPRAMHAEVPDILRALGREPRYAGFTQRLLAAPIVRPARVFDDTKVSDHHAIIPTDHAPQPDALSPDAWRLYDLVVRRFVGAFFADAEFDLTVLGVTVGEGVARPLSATPEAPPQGDDAPTDDVTLLKVLPPGPDTFVARGRVRVVAGWQEVAGFGDEAPSDAGDDAAPNPVPPLGVGTVLRGAYRALEKQTSPPRRLTDATLLAAMESAGRQVDDEALREALRDRGLGTPATRASTLETLITRGYIVRQGKSLAATALGEALVDGLAVPALASPELTGAWEERLVRIARGAESRARFMSDIKELVADMVNRVVSAPGVRAPRAAVASAARQGASRGASAPRPKARARDAAVAPKARAPRARKKAAPAPILPPGPPSLALGSDTGIVCPRCGLATLKVGRQGYGCGRWREGCETAFAFAEGVPAPAVKATSKRARKAPATRARRASE